MSENLRKRQRVERVQEEEVTNKTPTDFALYSAKQKEAIRKNLDSFRGFFRPATGVHMAEFVADHDYDPNDGDSPHTITIKGIHIRSAVEELLSLLYGYGFADTDVTVECKTEDLVIDEYHDDDFDLFSVSAKKDVYTVTVHVQPSMDQFPLLAAALKKGQGNDGNE
jgi:hypothetical protein